MTTVRNFTVEENSLLGVDLGTVHTFLEAKLESCIRCVGVKTPRSVLIEKYSWESGCRGSYQNPSKRSIEAKCVAPATAVATCLRRGIRNCMGNVYFNLLGTRRSTVRRNWSAGSASGETLFLRTGCAGLATAARLLGYRKSIRD
jgi:hypothetical protein